MFGHDMRWRWRAKEERKKKKKKKKKPKEKEVANLCLHCECVRSSLLQMEPVGKRKVLRVFTFFLFRRCCSDKSLKPSLTKYLMPKSHVLYVIIIIHDYVHIRR